MFRFVDICWHLIWLKLLKSPSLGVNFVSRAMLPSGLWLRCALIAVIRHVTGSSLGLTDGTGNTDLSVRIDFGGDNSQCGPGPICDALNASCLADDPPKLQLEICQDLYGMGVEYVTGATQQVSNYFGNSKCEGSPMSSETVAQGACTARGDTEKEARQYFPLVGACNNESTGDFMKHYVSEPQMWGEAPIYPTDVCLSNGAGDSKVFTVHDQKVFRVAFGSSSCTGEHKSVTTLNSATISEVFCLDFAGVNVDWNFDGTINNDGRDVTSIVVTTTVTTSTTTVSTRTTFTTTVTTMTTMTTISTTVTTVASDGMDGSVTTTSTTNSTIDGSASSVSSAARTFGVAAGMVAFTAAVEALRVWTNSWPGLHWKGQSNSSAKGDPWLDIARVHEA